MIGLGTWQASVSNMFFKGDVTFKIFDNGGKYAVETSLPEPINQVKCTFEDIQENGNTLSGNGKITAFGGKEVSGELTFDGDIMEGFLSIPFLGKVRLRDGKKISE